MMGTKPQPTRLERPKKEPLDRPDRFDGLLNAGSILESVADAIVVIAQDGMIIRVNAQTETLLGYTRDELVGRSVETLLPERARHQHVDARRDYSADPRPRPMGLGMDLYARRKDGQELPVEISLSPLKTAEGMFVISSIRDITERKELEQVLHERQLQLKAFFENSATDINLKDAEGRYILVSRQFEKTYGLARREAEGKFPHDIFPKDYADRVRAQDLVVLKTGKLTHHEGVVPDSEPPITLLVSKFPIMAETGETIGLGSIAADITERNRAEQALREAHDQLESRVQERTQELAEVNAALRVEVTVRKHAEQALLESERQSSEQLAELELLYRTAPLGLCHMDTDLRYLRCNEKLSEINGISSAEHIGRTLREIVPEIADMMESVYHQVIESGDPAIDVEATGATDADPQKIRHFSASYYPVKSEDGVVYGVSSIVQDITERKRAEQALREAHDQLESRVRERTQELTEANAALRAEVTERKRAHQALVESEARHRVLLETTNALPWEANAKSWCFSYVGPQAVKLFGYPLEQWYEKDFWVEHIHPEDREYAIDFCLKSSQRCQDFEFEYRMIAADGRSVWLHDIVSVVCENGVPHSLRGFMVDISNRRQAEEDVRMAQKEAAMHRDRLAHLVRVQTLGEMAAGIAHEINQPLAAIDSYARACRRRLLSGIDNPEKLEELLGKIAGQAKRAGHVVSRLRAMMQRRTIEPNRTNINTILQDVVSLAETDAGFHDCRLDLKPCAPVTYVIVDAIQIQQVVLNLIRNGIEAMEKIARGNEKVITVDATKSDADHIVVNVADRGVGVVPHSEADDIFEPFYSTKHSGMGMGLAISRNIIRAHGGEIWYSRNRAGGTTFHFSLPTETSEI